MALDYFNYRSPEWTILKRHLTEQRETKLKQLVGNPSDPPDENKSNQLRGAIQFIESLLKEEEAAAKAAERGNY